MRLELLYLKKGVCVARRTQILRQRLDHKETGLSYIIDQYLQTDGLTGFANSCDRI